MVVERVRQMSVEDFLDFVERSEEGYEYINGKPYKMTGGRLNHFVIITNIMDILLRELAGRDCQVLPSGMLIRVGEMSLAAPDVSVICGNVDTEDDTRILLNPTLVVEVTSPTSIDHDRVVKRDFYEAVESIQAYLIVDQHRLLVELYTRSETGWHLQAFTEPEAEIPLEALDCSMPLRDIYHRIRFEEESLPGQGEDS